MVNIPFSLVTTCRNEMKSLPRWKKNIQAQTRKPNEIVIVDAFSNDGTFEFLTEWANSDSSIKVIQEKGAAAHGRNVAIENAKYEHILSTDMGVGISNIWCEELIHPFEKENNIEIVAGNTCVDVETITTSVGWAEYYLENGGFLKLVEGNVPGNRSIAYKKDIWLKVGKLPEDLTFYADDSVFGRQLVQGKFKFGYAPKAMTYWGRPQKLSQFYREQFVYGKGDGEAFIKTPRAFKWYINKRIPSFLVPYFSLIFNVLKVSVWEGIGRAIKKRNISAAFLIPVLSGGRSFHHSKGYLIGFESGKTKSVDCRNRLSRDLNGYSIL